MKAIEQYKNLNPRNFIPHCKKNEIIKKGYLWILVHTSGEILKSPLHVGVSGKLASE